MRISDWSSDVCSSDLRVHDDQLGAVFAHDMRATGVLYRSAPATEGPPTGRCLIVVTSDAQRTMNTYLGSSELFGPEHVDGELIAAAQVTFLEEIGRAHV